jgi:hypothetical protein
MTLVPRSRDLPAASLLRLFQSKAVFSAFSTARAPPSTKKVGQVGVAEHAGEGLDEVGQVLGVGVGVGGLVAGDLAEQGGEVRVERRVHTERGRGEEGVEVQVAVAVAGVDQPGSVAEFEVQDESVSIDEQVAGKAGVYVHAFSNVAREAGGSF